jgi:ATP synthase protein I
MFLNDNVRVTMLNVIQWQLSAALLAACVGALLAGVVGALSATLAALAVVVPSCWFAARLTILARRGTISPVTFLIGAFAKVTAIIGFLILVAVFWSDVHWPALLLGVIMVVQANFLALWKKA